jgi:hypothetical protein
MTGGSGVPAVAEPAVTRSAVPIPSLTIAPIRVTCSHERMQKRCLGSPYAGRLIAEKQGFLVSVSESGGSELRDEEKVLERKTCECNVTAELCEVVLVGLADLLDDAVKAQAFEKA